MKAIPLTVKGQRDCGDCAACCSGTLRGEAKGIPFYPGAPCQFTTGSSCTIYADRPQACQDFRCVWLDNEDIPAWMRPDLANGIMTRRRANGIDYVDLHEVSDQRISATTLSWYVAWAIPRFENVKWTIQGGWRAVGSPEFLAALNVEQQS